MTISCICSEGTLAYHWSQFDIPEMDQEIVPELTEQRVIEALQKTIRQEGKRFRTFTITSNDITASRKMIANYKERAYLLHSHSAVIRVNKGRLN